jgi:pimeloyl-ACP methyl ester carboxylesterase
MPDTLRQQITAALASLPPGDHKITLTVQGRPVHMALRRDRRAAAMLVNFHGAVDRKTRTLPVFINFLPGLAGVAHQISVADPSVLEEGSANIAWYAGDAGFEAQAVLPAVFTGLAEELGVARTLYFGTSGGGFAALYYAHQHPGSFAVAGNPQVAIERYHLALAIRRYREQCWPGLGTDAPLTDVTCADLARLYAKGFDNTVIYVQSIGDRMHFENQMMYFVAGLSEAGKRNRFLLHSDFWGKIGHIPAPRDYLRWIQAVCTSPTTEIADILAMWQGLEPVAATPVAASAAKAKKSGDKPTVFDAGDVAMAARLRALRGTNV